jgi:hypothetical protein
LTKSLPLITEALLVRVRNANVRHIQLSKNRSTDEPVQIRQTFTASSVWS